MIYTFVKEIKVLLGYSTGLNDILKVFYVFILWKEQ